MPLTGSFFNGVDSPYFKSLEELDAWAATPKRALDVVKYHPRPPFSDPRGKLLVCHDYKGGYTESPFSLGYTFSFWSAVDIFVYFSHHRITVPPPGWITAAHRQGVKILGTLIFENSGENDCLRLLVGRLPQSKTGSARQASDRSLPLSPHYARLLAALAHVRGFDGYLLNFECPLRGGMEQTRSLAAWITILVDEMKSKIGPHAEAVWYDSVVITGQLAWQDRLNSFNLPFFLSSTAFFTNYTWPPSYIAKTKQYFESVNQTAAHVSPKTLRDIYVGIDVFGRGSHGAGGFGTYKALEHITPARLSTAFFAPGWTWESTQDAPGFTWESWFASERKLWTGPRVGEQVVVPPAPANRQGEPPCTHGPFAPVASFFVHQAPPDPREIPLHTTFSPGVGRSWWVDGVRVFQRPGREGWTDVDKQTSIGDLVWPVPMLAWEGEVHASVLPAATSEVTLDQAWNGGSCLRLGISATAEAGEDAEFRCIWLPVQSVSVTPNQSYEAVAVYRLDEEDPNVDLDISLSVKTMDSSDDAFEVTPQALVIDSLPGGWLKLCVRFELSASAPAKAALGFVISIISADTSQALQLSLLLGQLNVYSAPALSAPPPAPMLLWADFAASGSPNAPLDGTLTWEVAATFTPLAGAGMALPVTGPEDPNPAWPLAPSVVPGWFPRFMYFNVYAHAGASPNPAPEDARWIGTSGGGGQGQAFAVRQANLSFELAGARAVTFYVQGVTDRGEVLPWNQCVFVNVPVS